MRRGLLVVVVLLAVASMMAAMAYTAATVRNPATFTVTNTAESLIGIEPLEGRGNFDEAAYIGEDGMLKFDLRKGLNGGLFGLQPFSHYDWNPLFKVTNNSNEKIQFHLCFENGNHNKPWNSRGEFTAGIVNVDGSVGNQPQNKTEILIWDDGYVKQDNKVLNPGEWVWVRLQIDVEPSASEDIDEVFDTNVILCAQAID